MADLIQTPPDQWMAEHPGETLYEFATAPATITSWQGGTIVLRYYGCHNCGNAFWTEDDRARALIPGTLHPCPHCGIESLVVRQSNPSIN